ncbi:MAG: hypothetical protein HYR85_10615 [Planctomycetes bacterium]|nr:hypothetical protein [Planctomycetota bacterium]MBI3848002.1 hypothetical protein [Planctomycetota bacterium]
MSLLSRRGRAAGLRDDGFVRGRGNIEIEEAGGKTMDWRRQLIVLVSVLGTADVARASGGTIRPATAGNIDYVTVVQVPTGPNDRVITRFGVLGAPYPYGSEFDPNSVLCGARTRAGHQSHINTSRPMLVDVRVEDPNNPGFPDVGPDAPAGAATFPAGADSNATPPQCSVFVSFRDYTFHGGAGIADPLVPCFLSFTFAPPNLPQPCYFALETSAPNNGRAYYYNSVVQQYVPSVGNLWLDLNVASPAVLRLNCSMHGLPQFPGDRGRPVWFIRNDEAGTCVDDFISTTIVVDNLTQAPIGRQTLSLVADRSPFNPNLRPKDLVASLRMVGDPSVSLADGNPYTWPPGRTVLRATIPSSVSVRFQQSLPLNLPIFAATRTMPGPGPMEFARTALGLRRHRGQIDDGSAEGLFTVQSPARTDDVIAQRFPIRRLFSACSAPISTLRVTQMQVFSTRNGGRGGWDAVTLRRDDPVLENASDESPQGYLGGVGRIGDGIVDVPVPLDPTLAHLSKVCVPIDPPALLPLAEDVWIVVNPFPGDTMTAGTFVGQDRTPETVIGESFFGTTCEFPYIPDPTSNWMIRLIFDAVPFAGFVNAAELEPPVRVAARLPIHVGNSYPVRTVKDLASSPR